MSNAAVSHPGHPTPGAAIHVPRSAAAILALWLALVLALGAAQMFSVPAGALPVAIFLAVVVPIGAFGVALRALPAFRRAVLDVDLRLITAIQAWRFAGFGFVALYAHGVLPGLFAWPAGLGDMAVGLTAPWIAIALLRRPDFAASRTFLAWNLFGILDLVVAVGTGALGNLLAGGLPGEPTMSPMAQLPLLLIPAYFVPLFIMLHLAALLQRREQRTSFRP